MELEILRYNGGPDASLGLLFDNTETRELLCFTCEDEKQNVKVKGETRISPGRYRVELRTEGPMHARYAEKFPRVHKGMLWFRHVPNFEFVYFHIGNTDDDTEGCVLLGEDRDEDARTVKYSTNAYLRIYPKIAAAVLAGEPVFVTVRDFDTPSWC